MKVVMKKTGQIKNVQDGYAKNYLLPNGLAVQATEQAVGQAQQQEAQRKQSLEKQQREWNTAIAALQSQSLEIVMPANNEGVLFGAVTAKEIVAAAKTQGLAMDAVWLSVLHIKSIGNHDIRLTLPNKKQYSVTIRVTAKG